MEAQTIKELAIAFVIFAYGIYILAGAYVKISSVKSKNHPNATKGGKHKK
ncbi:MAG: hypothetical protein IJH55_06805 [Romboutsia sp.]|nr:hypothetical protein [Romboutsia sp.]